MILIGGVHGVPVASGFTISFVNGIHQLKDVGLGVGATKVKTPVVEAPTKIVTSVFAESVKLTDPARHPTSKV